jgi:hypothetical protein
MSQKSEANLKPSDDRMIIADQLRAKVCESNILSPQQRQKLYAVLLKYQQHMTNRPGRCNVFQYEFKIEGNMLSSANCRPIPFALRAQVRDQIQAMLRDGILEESYSAYELRDESGKLRGEFNKKQLRMYQKDDDETQIYK